MRLSLQKKKHNNIKEKNSKGIISLTSEINRYIVDFKDIAPLIAKFIRPNQFLLLRHFFYMGKINLYEIDTKYIVKNHGFVIEKENIFSEKFLENVVDEDTFDDLKINKKTKFEKLKYIFKSQMILFFFKRNLTIKVLIHSMGIFL